MTHVTGLCLTVRSGCKYEDRGNRTKAQPRPSYECPKNLYFSLTQKPVAALEQLRQFFLIAHAKLSLYWRNSRRFIDFRRKIPDYLVESGSSPIFYIIPCSGRIAVYRPALSCQSGCRALNHIRDNIRLAIRSEKTVSTAPRRLR